MHKVVIERPRWNPGPGKNRRRANLPDELWPKFEGIKRPHSCRKGLTDLLGPLKRWLQSQVGRPWNDVYSEACAVIKPDSIIRAHVKTHLLQFVQRNTFMHDGVVSYLATGRGGGIRPVLAEKFFRRVFYVHPETGLLEKIEPVSRKQWNAGRYRSDDKRRWIRRGVALQQIRGLWFECHFEVVPVDVRFKAYDHAWERVVSRGELARHESDYLLCKRKRQLSRQELRRYGLQNVLQFEAQSSVAHTHGRLTTALRFSAGRRFWVIGHCRLAVQIRFRVSARIAQSGRATVLSKSLLARLPFDRPKLWVIVGCRFESDLLHQTGQ
jgi:hypothetical protein